DADLQDGLLDVAIVQPLSRTRLVALKPRLPTGELRDHPAVLRRQATSVHVEMPGAVAYADGERLGPLPLDITAAPPAPQVVACPKTSGRVTPLARNRTVHQSPGGS